jgi:hypothetical protein
MDRRLLDWWREVACAGTKLPCQPAPLSQPVILAGSPPSILEHVPLLLPIMQHLWSMQHAHVGKLDSIVDSVQRGCVWGGIDAGHARLRRAGCSCLGRRLPRRCLPCRRLSPCRLLRRLLLDKIDIYMASQRGPKCVFRVVGLAEMSGAKCCRIPKQRPPHLPTCPSVRVLFQSLLRGGLDTLTMC